MANWFVTIEGKERGPLTDAQLRQLAQSGKLQRFDHVRREGSDRQLEAVQLKGLFEPIPPNASETTHTASTASDPAARRQRADAAPIASQPRASRRVLIIVGITFLSLLMFGALGKAIRPERSREPDVALGGSSTVEPQLETPASDAPDEADPDSANRVRAELKAAVLDYLPEWEKLLTSCDELQSLTANISAEFQHAERLSHGLGHLGRTIEFSLRYPAQWHFGSGRLSAIDVLVSSEESDVDEWLKMRAQNEAEVKRLINDIDRKLDVFFASDVDQVKLAKLIEQGPPQLVSPKTTDWTDRKWKRYNKSEMKEIKERMRRKYEFELEEETKSWERDSDRYEEEVKRLEVSVRESRARLKASIMNELQPLHDSLSASPTEMIVKRHARCRRLLGELKAHVERWDNLLSSHEPQPPANDLVHAGGITHLIEGDLHFVDNKVISIPQEFRNLYYDGVAGPNEVVVTGLFRFAGNTNGKNAFGASVRVEKYECDREYSLYLTQQRRYSNQIGDILREFRRGNRNGKETLLGHDRLLRVLLGDDAKYDAIVKDHPDLIPRK